ncbi:glycoside hydrolase family 104 protein [Cyanobium sp. Candia 9D4]|uniref:glycoside hydrolase family 24 protein n=1 Tax=Cyanobium sp. Candia 9D4 TaxID=2823707 RepID=UPI0020CCEA82|nr:glycoside hydrolase family 104 protein [Cyanobium sp. Candia 9D4]MCP9933034.1 glycoside hydrolase family 104 protein [Cyanobium sp. Candia 9D4]
MPNLQRTPLLLALAGLGLSLAGPVRAAEGSQGWGASSVAPAGPTRMAMLSPLPAAPRVFAITPERRALLNTIRYAEGTWANGHEIGYRILFGGSLFDSLERHPNRVMRTARYASAAAGAYQFMPFTWDMVTRALGVSDFGPESQDQAALFLVQRRGALHLADRGELTPDLAARLAPEWASFPTLAGRSFYGQPVKRLNDLRRFYEQNLAQLRREEAAVWEDVAIRQVPPACNDASLSCQLERVSTPAP